MEGTIKELKDIKEPDINNCCMIITREKGPNGENLYKVISPEPPTPENITEVAISILAFGYNILGDSIATVAQKHILEMYKELGFKNPFELENQNLKKTIESLEFALDKLSRKEDVNA